MRRERFRNPRLVLAIWAGTVLVAVSVSLYANVLLMRHVEQIRAEDPAPHLNAAEGYLNRNSVPEAWAEIRKAQEKAPDDPRVYKVSGDLHFREREWMPAIDSYARAIEKGSGAPGVFSNTLWALIELGRFKEAVVFGEKCIAQGLQQAIIYRYTAEAYIRAGEREKAIPFLENALERYVKDLYLMRQLADAYQSMGRKSKADALRQHIKEIESAIPPTRSAS